MVCITDANIWIDLNVAGLILRVFALEVTWATPDIILEELDTVDAAWLLELGVEPRTLTPEQVERTYALAEQYRRPSEADLAALVLAADEAALLVTGDGALREAAAEQHVAVHGILWLLDRLVEEAVIQPPTAADGLQRMLDEGARLPHAKVEALLRRWRILT